MRNKVFPSLIALALGCFYCFGDIAIYPSLLDKKISSSRLYLDRHEQILRLTTNSQDQFLIKLKRKDYPESLVDLMLSLEDRYFYSHPGINPFSFLNAIYEKIFLSKNLRGSSTITMQLARVAYGLQTRTILGKIQQMVYALGIELAMSKDQILTAFLNLAPMGRNIQGLETGAFIYFNRSLKNLSLEEMALLCSIPQRPNLMNYKSTFQIPDHHLKRASHLLKKLHDDSDRFSLKGMELKSIEQLPFRAGHLVDELEANFKNLDKSQFVTTLDYGIQKNFKNITKQYIKEKQKDGLNNVVVMLMDWVDNEILAYHGSADFFNDEINGQVNGTLMQRSPGSTLKPFAYALGIDQGLIYPGLIIHDAPSMYKLPQNYDRRFLGPISVERALNESRNVPAVVLSSKLKAPSFHQFLKNTGVDDLREQSFYGHTLVLGTKELSLQHIMKYYASLARNGVYRNFSLLKNKKIDSDDGVSIFSKEAAVMVKEMLKKTARPVFSKSPYQAFSDDVYWKTGTSWGYRDAWTFGIQGRYVLGVWTGNFSGKVSEKFVGIQSAAPVFFRYLDSLPRKKRSMRELWHKYAEKVVEVKVCPVSGKIPSKHCPHRKTTTMIEGVSSTAKCENHREILISKKSKKRSCLEDQEEASLKVYEFWPSHIQKLYEQIGLYLQGPPDFNEACSKYRYTHKGISPQITYPKRNEAFVLGRNENQGTFALNASAEVGVKKLFWYSRQEFLGTSSPQNPLQVSLQAGVHPIRVVDDLGRSSHKIIKVIYK